MLFLCISRDTNFGTGQVVYREIEPDPTELTKMGHGGERGVDEADSFVALHCATSRAHFRCTLSCVGHSVANLRWELAALAVDSSGDVYCAEVSWVNPEMGGSGLDPPRELRSLHKYKRTG